MDSRTPHQQQSQAEGDIYTLLLVLSTNFNDLDSNIRDLQRRFNDLKCENTKMDYARKAALALTLLTAATYAVLFLVYFSAKTNDKELSALKGMFWDGAFFALFAALYKYYFTSPEQRTFRLYDYASHVIKNGYPEMSQHYDAVVSALEMFQTNLHLTYSQSKDQEKMALVYQDLEEAIKLFKTEKPNMTIDKMENELRKLAVTLNQAKYEAEHTQGYKPGLFTENNYYKHFANAATVPEPDREPRLATMV